MFKFIHGRARTLFLVLATQQQLFESKVDTMDLFHYLEVVRKRQTETHACINSSSSSSRCISYGLVPGVVQPLASLEIAPECDRATTKVMPYVWRSSVLFVHGDKINTSGCGQSLSPHRHNCHTRVRTNIVAVVAAAVVHMSIVLVFVHRVQREHFLLLARLSVQTRTYV